MPSAPFETKDLEPLQTVRALPFPCRPPQALTRTRPRGPAQIETLWKDTHSSAHTYRLYVFKEQRRPDRP